jgi:hypothetical protein
MRLIALFVSLVALLSGCATSYTPTTRPDAAKLRLRLLNTGGVMHLTTFLRPVAADRTCGEPVRTPLMYTHLGPPAQTREPLSDQKPPTFPRADMIGSPDPFRSDVIELQVDPGRYSLRLVGALGTLHCEVTTEVELTASGQHEVSYSINRATMQCLAAGTRIAPDGRHTPAAVRPHAQLCKS